MSFSISDWKKVFQIVLCEKRVSKSIKWLAVFKYTNAKEKNVEKVEISRLGDNRPEAKLTAWGKKLTLLASISRQPLWGGRKLSSDWAQFRVKSKNKQKYIYIILLLHWPRLQNIRLLDIMKSRIEINKCYLWDPEKSQS